ncbi:hypothetical protein BN2475_340017 [Paraburkholderia ribeironis]|uniref:Uncharacterized protein n=1 Tax=Paraburkholderia ribeironis TaxID=1247936 RepID=A0A1N7S3T6_9BURK|nr:hypothetical protein BN2475_340017 [Paraburkholderia ribeironis]
MRLCANHVGCFFDYFGRKRVGCGFVAGMTTGTPSSFMPYLTSIDSEHSFFKPL